MAVAAAVAAAGPRPACREPEPARPRPARAWAAAGCGDARGDVRAGAPPGACGTRMRGRLTVGVAGGGSESARMQRRRGAARRCRGPPVCSPALPGPARECATCPHTPRALAARKHPRPRTPPAAPSRAGTGAGNGRRRRLRARLRPGAPAAPAPTAPPPPPPPPGRVARAQGTWDEGRRHGEGHYTLKNGTKFFEIRDHGTLVGKRRTVTGA